jgi:CRP/FNR family transcriptional regulator, cyclic AMP receptor protein
MKTIPVLRFDPDLGAGLAEPRLSRAQQVCLARAVDVPRGSWEVSELAPDEMGFGLLVLSGILCRRVVQGECYGAELIGPGDLLRPWDTIGDWSSIPSESSWLALEPARLALLDRGFVHRASPYPELSVQLLRRGLLRSRYLATLAAVISQRRIETRLTMLFWHLADRFGHIRGEWIEIPVPLTHSVLAELVAARRPSVTTALSQLHARDVLHRERRGWRLRGQVPAELLEAQAACPSSEAGRTGGGPASGRLTEAPS